MRPTREPAILTVAAVRESAGNGIECLFNERQQIFTLPRAARPREPALRRLREALDRRAPVKATLNPRRGVVERVAEPSGRELREFEKLRIPLEKPEKMMRIDVSRSIRRRSTSSTTTSTYRSSSCARRQSRATRSPRTSSTSARPSRATCPGRPRSRTASRSNTCATAATPGRTRCGRSSRTSTATAPRRSSASR